MRPPGRCSAEWPFWQEAVSCWVSRHNWPSLFSTTPCLPAVGSKPVIGISWLGLTAGSGDWFTTPGLILAILAIGAGVLVYWIAVPAQPKISILKGSPNAMIDVFSGGETLTGSSHLSA